MIGKSFFAFLPSVAFLSFLPFSCGDLGFDSNEDGGVYRSQDRGKNWQQMKVDEDQPPLVSSNILSIAVDPKDSENIYIGTDGSGLYKSCCEGEYWRKVNDENKSLSAGAKIYDIEIDPKEPKRVYLATHQGGKGRLFKSENGGKNWQEIYVTSKEKPVSEVEVDGYDNSIVYLGIEEGGLLKSEDYGVSWSVSNWFDNQISDIIINPGDTRQVYVATSDKGVYRSDDKGANWKSFKEQLGEFDKADDIKEMAVDSVNGNNVYLVSKESLLTSENNGENWRRISIIMPEGSEPILSLAVDPQDSEILYYGAGSNLYRSGDKGKNWRVFDLNSGRSVKTIAIDPNNPETIYVGMYD